MITGSRIESQCARCEELFSLLQPSPKTASSDIVQTNLQIRTTDICMCTKVVLFVGMVIDWYERASNANAMCKGIDCSIRMHTTLHPITIQHYITVPYTQIYLSSLLPLSQSVVVWYLSPCLNRYLSFPHVRLARGVKSSEGKGREGKGSESPYLSLNHATSTNSQTMLVLHYQIRNSTMPNTARFLPPHPPHSNHLLALLLLFILIQYSILVDGKTKHAAKRIHFTV